MSPEGRRPIVPFLMGVLLAAGCTPKAPLPIAPPSRNGARVVDFPLAWSPDGRTIAYSRVIPSKDGPPGVYLLDLQAHRARWAAQANLLSPKRGRFSSDGKLVCCVTGNQVTVIDTERLNSYQPFYTSSLVESADWLENSHVLVYSRRFAPPALPAESTGIHLFDLDSREDRPIFPSGSPAIGGREVTTIPSASQVAYLAGQDLRSVSIPAGAPHVLYTNGTAGALSYLTPYHDPIVGRGGLLFASISGSQASPYFLQARAAEPLPFPPFQAPYCVPSWDGGKMLRQGVDPLDSSVVLFQEFILGPSAGQPRQVTSYR